MLKSNPQIITKIGKKSVFWFSIKNGLKNSMQHIRE